MNLAELLVRPVRPVPVADFSPPPRAIADGLWTIDRQLRLSGVTMPTRMTVLRLPGRGLLLHSPIRLDDPTREAIGALGRVDALVAPNSFHYLFLAEQIAAHPGAAVYLAPGLRERRRDLPSGVVLGDEPPATWAADMDQLVFGPMQGVSEVVFFHRPTVTLILTDLAFACRTSDRPGSVPCGASSAWAADSARAAPADSCSCAIRGEFVRSSRAFSRGRSSASSSHTARSSTTMRAARWRAPSHGGSRSRLTASWQASADRGGSSRHTRRRCRDERRK